jgi:hypothetical protein
MDEEYIKAALIETYGQMIKELHESAKSACKHSGLEKKTNHVFMSVIYEATK